ncbi:dynein regulatory complex protein 8 isoform X2 [Halichoerus grypus]|uniref:dynein regulatory complex protein 8 isoform X2 n=1 Tax=Phoca vitulina TaxID=9720 RepID=UPI00139601DF|nr:dynein regulatory complex protein 8 isoform X2 [Phoca vitulina]
MADDKEREGTEIAVAEYHKKIKEAFEVFDHEANNTVDVREIGTIIRSLGCCPSEGELHDLIAEVEEEEPTGYIRFEKFLPVMTEVLLERRYRPSPEDTLLRAFEVLDPSKRGFLTKEELIKYMTEEAFQLMNLQIIQPPLNGIHTNLQLFMLVELYICFELDLYTHTHSAIVSAHLSMPPCFLEALSLCFG